jgi:hypothetical protein
MAEMHHKEIEVYLPSGLLKGTIVTRHERVSDHLAMPDEAFLLANTSLAGSEAQRYEVVATSALIYKRLVIMVADVGAAARHRALDAQLMRVERQPHRVLVGVGPFWVRGEVHLPAGADLESAGLGKAQFIPLTAATFLGHPDSHPVTFIINRDQINCVVIDPVETSGSSG